ncbi:PD-(D/E)XK nuclease-like domain-containing protein [Zooshikella marina]|uniref:PD-(D/E)XK nuclease-like domain-containing protein n=1 Tax=Zooshikella ganghwensis TaxID=202772 RepID=UPI001BAE67A5|nr:PD-(D/E)XK nuclease-like domain-containing protein [Zooshikella ganghwensis]MBU2708852.1 PD-(D/E)XK nuclease-like domain-containing protein [Zooshikella ganghwensis]
MQNEKVNFIDPYLPFDQYLDINAISASHLREYNYSPRAYYDRFVTKKVIKPTTTAMQEGQMIHHFVLENHTFFEHYNLLDESKKILTTLEALKAECKKLGIKVSGSKETLMQRLLDKDETYIDCFPSKSAKPTIDSVKLDQLQQIRAEIFLNSNAEEIILSGKPEVSCITDSKNFSELPWKCRLDLLSEQMGLIFELKTVDDIKNKVSLGYKILDMSYDIQAAHNIDVFKKITGERLNFLFIVAQRVYPFKVATVKVTRSDFDIALQKRNHLLKKLSRSFQEEYWPSFSHKQITLNLYN